MADAIKLKEACTLFHQPNLGEEVQPVKLEKKEEKKKEVPRARTDRVKTTTNFLAEGFHMVLDMVLVLVRGTRARVSLRFT